jgi:hypothetical protein
MFDEIRILKDEESKRVYGVILDRPEVRRAVRGEVGGWREGESTSEATCTAEEGGEDEEISGQIVKISISHDGEYATAVCLASEGNNGIL